MCFTFVIRACRYIEYWKRHENNFICSVMTPLAHTTLHTFNAISNIVSRKLYIYIFIWVKTLFFRLNLFFICFHNPPFCTFTLLSNVIFLSKLLRIYFSKSLFCDISNADFKIKMKHFLFLNCNAGYAKIEWNRTCYWSLEFASSMNTSIWHLLKYTHDLGVHLEQIYLTKE